MKALVEFLEILGERVFDNGPTLILLVGAAAALVYLHAQVWPA